MRNSEFSLALKELGKGGSLNVKEREAEARLSWGHCRNE